MYLDPFCRRVTFFFPIKMGYKNCVVINALGRFIKAVNSNNRSFSFSTFIRVDSLALTVW